MKSLLYLPFRLSETIKKNCYVIYFAVTVSEELIDSIFAPLPQGEEWTPLER